VISKIRNRFLLPALIAVPGLLTTRSRDRPNLYGVLPIIILLGQALISQ